jgi:hypothetical protein
MMKIFYGHIKIREDIVGVTGGNLCGGYPFSIIIVCDFARGVRGR